MRGGQERGTRTQIYASLIFSRQSTSICGVSRSVHPKLQAMSQLMGQTERSISQRIEGAATRLECHRALYKQNFHSNKLMATRPRFQSMGLDRLLCTEHIITDLYRKILIHDATFCKIDLVSLPAAFLKNSRIYIDQSLKTREDGQSWSDEIKFML